MKIKLGKSDKVFHVLNYIFLLLALLSVLFPILNVIASSFSSPNAVVGGRVTIFPVELNFEAYKQVFQSNRIVRGFLNTVGYTVFGTMINIVLTIMIAYPISRKKIIGRKAIIGFLSFTMIFSGGMIPTFLVVNDLGLYDTFWALLIPNALSVWNVMIARSFFENTIPGELYEAAEIDGCSEIRMLFNIVLPLSTSVIAVLVLYYAIGHWNTYMSGLIYLKDPNLQPLQVVLRNILANTEQMREMVDQSMTGAQANVMAQVEVMKYAIIVAGTLPIAILYPFIQKHFTKGVMIGSVKG